MPKKSSVPPLPAPHLKMEASVPEVQPLTLAVRSLIADTQLDITHEHYAPLAEQLSGFLQSGYSDRGIQAEYMLTKHELLALKSHCPTDWWDRNRIARHKWVERMKAGLLRNPGTAALQIVQTLDREWNPKVDLTVRSGSRPLEEMTDDELQSMARYGAPEGDGADGDGDGGPSGGV